MAWSEPPGPTRKRIAKGGLWAERLQDLYPQLRTHPGRWAVLGVHPSAKPYAARNRAQALRAIYPALQFTVRQLVAPKGALRHGVWVRYVGRSTRAQA